MNSEAWVISVLPASDPNPALRLSSVAEPELDDAVDRQLVVAGRPAAAMPAVEDEVLRVAPHLRQPLHEDRVDIEPLALERLGADVGPPLSVDMRLISGTSSGSG